MKNVLVCLCFALLSVNTFSQNNPLDKKVSVKLNKQPVEKVLLAISRAGGIGFSYNSDQLPLDSLVSVDFTKKAIYQILDITLQKKYIYKTAGQHVIIMRKKELRAKTSGELEYINIKGAVYEWGSGRRLPNASVCNVLGKEGVLTDANGNFNIVLKPKGRFVQLAFNKQNYLDTIVILKTKDKQEIDIVLVQRIKEIDPILPQLSSLSSQLGVEQNKWVSKLVDPKMIIHANNMNYFTQRPAQISFLPYTGSNYKQSGSIVNKLSLNVLAGYSYGVSGVEVGGMVNINRRDVKGVQIAGVGNITGRNLNGVGIAGLFNHCLGNVRGAQVAGGYNTLQDSIFGVQVAGFANILNGKIQGAQVAGVINITTKEVNAAQIAGFANVAMKDNRGIQIAGVSNLAKGNHEGAQVSGFNNVVDGRFKGVQISGCSNTCKQDINGIQIAGLVNFAHQVKGVQLGLINFADSVSGVSIGFLSFVKKGIHQLSLHADEMGGVNFNFMCGSSHLYNIIGLSAFPFQSQTAWGMTYGLGSRFFPEQKIALDLKLTNTSLVINNKQTDGMTTKMTLSSEFSFKTSKRTSIFIGPSLNVFTYLTTRAELNDFPNSTLFSSSEVRTVKDQSIKYWLGASLGLVYVL